MMDKKAILDSLSIPKGDADLGGTPVRIRGLSAGEEVMFAGDQGYAANMLQICAACIIDDDDNPLFTPDELDAMRSGVLSPVLVEILKISFPKKGNTRKNS